MYPSLLPRAETSSPTPSHHSRECGNLRGPCPTTYSWEHPSPRKVTGCIRRMVGGWRIQIPAYAGMTWGRWGCSGRHGGLRSVCTLRLPLICPSKGYTKVSESGNPYKRGPKRHSRPHHVIPANAGTLRGPCPTMYPSLLPRAETSFPTPSRHSRECGNLATRVRRCTRLSFRGPKRHPRPHHVIPANAGI